MTGSLQVKNNKYYAVLNLCKDGNRKQKWINTGFSAKENNKRKANEQLNFYLNEYNNPHVCQNELFSQCVRNWLKSVKIKIDDVTYQGYKVLADQHILPYFDKKKTPISELNHFKLQAYFDEKFENGKLNKKGGLSPKSLRMHKNIINQTFKKAIKDGVVDKNPCDLLDLPKLNHKAEQHYTPELVHNLLNAIKDEPLKNLIMITIYYGLRRSEVLGLKWDSVDFENNSLTIKHTVAGVTKFVEKDKTKTKSSYRSYPLFEKSYAIFQEELKKEEQNKKLFGNQYQNSDYIFKKANGEKYRPDYITSKFSKILIQNGLPHIRFHDLRHTCASILVSNGYGIKDVQEWLGHSDIQTTANTYAHLEMKRKQQLGEFMNQL